MCLNFLGSFSVALELMPCTVAQFLFFIFENLMPCIVIPIRPSSTHLFLNYLAKKKKKGIYITIQLSCLQQIVSNITNLHTCPYTQVQNRELKTRVQQVLLNISNEMRSW